MASKKRHMIRGGTDQEDASNLKLGPGNYFEWHPSHNILTKNKKKKKNLQYIEFDGAQCLYISEVRIILEAQEDSKENGTDNRPRTK